MRALVPAILCFFVAAGALAQACPKESSTGPPIESRVQTVRGMLVLHRGLRVWMELRPKEAVCGNLSLQVLHGGGAFEVDEGNSEDLEVFRGCEASVTGRLGIPGTGYYSAPLYLEADKVETVQGCARKPPLPDFSHAKPAPGVRRYNVLMHINYRGEGSVIAEIRGPQGTLHPWQAYANYWLTGGYVFNAQCADGFSPSSLHGTPQANPSQTDDMLALDPESAAQKHVWRLWVRYTCTRTPTTQ